MSKVRIPERYDFVGSFLRPEALKKAKHFWGKGKSPRLSTTML